MYSLICLIRSSVMPNTCISVWRQGQLPIAGTSKLLTHVWRKQYQLRTGVDVVMKERHNYTILNKYGVTLAHFTSALSVNNEGTTCTVCLQKQKRLILSQQWPWKSLNTLFRGITWALLMLCRVPSDETLISSMLILSLNSGNVMKYHSTRYWANSTESEHN